MIDGLRFEGVAANAIYQSGVNPVSDVVIQNCTFTNLGNNGIYMSGFFDRVAVIHNTFRQSHGSLLTMIQTRAPSMIPDHNVVQNNTFLDPTPNHQVGISLSGCLSVISHNYLINTNINLNGPAYECIIEYNRLDGGSEDVGDGGQIYMYGLYTRGNHIRYNVLHGLNYSGNSIYNDGMCSGNYSYYNICSTLTGYRESQQKCFYVSTGHNNIAFNNIFITRNAERYLSNLEAHGKTPSSSLFTPPGALTARRTGDCAMYESTLFYADTDDAGYATAAGRSDAASYSFDALYKSAAGKFTGNTAYRYYDIEKFRGRFPNYVASMEGAWDLFMQMEEMGKDYDRRTEVLAMEARYAAIVDIFTGAVTYDAAALEDEEHILNAKAEEIDALVNEYGTALDAAAAEEIAFRLGYGYSEDFFRQPAYNIYKNNVILGGDADFYFDTDSDGVYGEDRKDYVFSDYLNNRGAVNDDGMAMSGGNDPFTRDLRIIESNFYCSDYDLILASCDYDAEYISNADYSFVDGALDLIRETIPDYYDFQPLAWGS